MELRHNTLVCAGGLGSLALRQGFYLYIGSAFGPGGLSARIRHHLVPTRRPHWHVDYLRRHAVPREVWYATGARFEHRWAAAAATMKGATLPAPGFGSSDCLCRSHLSFFRARPSLRSFQMRLGLPRIRIHRIIVEL